MSKLQNHHQHQRERIAHGWWLYPLVLVLLLVLSRSNIVKASEANDLAWQPETCKTKAAFPDSNIDRSEQKVFVNKDLARKTLETPGIGRLEINSLQGKNLTVFVFRPDNFDAEAGRIWFVMHGTERDARRYLKRAIPVARRHKVLLLVLEFSRDQYPDGDAYTIGMNNPSRMNAHAAEGSASSNSLHTPHMEIERTFSSVRKTLKSKQPGYFIFGHSAGAQFVHRLLSFVRCPRVLKAVAANAGWYTLSTIDKKWAPFPYSLRGTAPDFKSPRQVLAAPLTILLGSEDTRGNEEDRRLRGSKSAMAQGANRLQRGVNYYRVGRQEARTAGWPFGWKVQIVPDAEHKVEEVISTAGDLLFAD